MTKQKNITVAGSGLSQLQKRILAYARRRMVEQGQTIDPQPDYDDSPHIYIVAPDWLQKVVVESTTAVLQGRKRGHRDGRISAATRYTDFSRK